MNSTANIYALCYCTRFDFKALQDYLHSNHRSVAFKQVLNVEWRQGDVFIFEYGVLVFWNNSNEERQEFLEKIHDYAYEPLSILLEDEFTYETSAESLQIKNDHILLTDDEVITRLAASHGIAQSTKLAQFEYRVQQTINETAHIPKKLPKLAPRTCRARNYRNYAAGCLLPKVISC